MADSDGTTPTKRTVGNRPQLGVSLLGHLRMTYGGEPFVFTTRRKAIPLLALLLLHRTENLARDFVAFTLWPDDQEDDARSKLRSTIFELQRSLPPEGDAPWLIASNTTLRWNPEAAVDFDVERFEATCAGRGDIVTALDAYAGDFLEGIHDEWILAERERLRTLLVAALERSIDKARRDGDALRAVSYAQRLLAIDPFREDVVRRIMALRHEAGDRAGALAEFRRFEKLAREDLGVEPMPETLALRHAIVRDELAYEPAGDPDAGVAPPRHPVPAFVGRTPELDLLRGRWSGARQKRGGLIFVAGEAGIGKSALVSHFAREVADGGGRVVRGTTSSPETLPYECAIDALRGSLPLVAALRLEPVWMQTLATLIPEIDARSNDRTALPELAGEARGDRLREAFGRAIAALAAPRPLLLVLEDLHWASAATLALVNDLARRATVLPLLIVGTYRNDEAVRDHPLARLVRELHGCATVGHVSLGALDAGDIAALARSADVPAARAARVYETSRGNAFYAVQLLSAETGDANLPHDVREFVAERIARLPDDARHVAEIAAMLGAQFSHECVREVAGWDDAEVADALDVLVARRLVRERGGRGAFDFAFAHQIVCDVIEALAPGSVDRHRRVARVLGSCLPGLAADLAAKIASHYERAGDASEAVRQYAIAARRALDLGSLPDADRSVDRGLALASTPAERTELLKLGLEIAARSHVAGERARLDALEQLASDIDDDELRDFVAIARATGAARIGTGEALRHATAALYARAKATGNAYLDAVAKLAEARGAQPYSAERAATSLATAVRTFREHGDTENSVLALAALWIAVRRLNRTDEAIAYETELAPYAEAGRPYAVRKAAVRAQFLAAQESGDIAEAARAADLWVSIAVAAGDRREEVVALESSSWPLLLRSLPGQALAVLESAIAIGVALGAHDLSIATKLNRAVVLSRIGAFDETIDAVAQTATDDFSPDCNATAQSMLTTAYAYRRELATARRCAARGLAALGDQPLGSKLANYHEGLATVELLAGNFTEASAHGSEAAAIRSGGGIPGFERGLAIAALARARAGDIAGAKAAIAAIAAAGNAAQILRVSQAPERTATFLALAAHRTGDEAGARSWLSAAERVADLVLADLNPTRAAAYERAPWMRAMRAARGGAWENDAL